MEKGRFMTPTELKLYKESIIRECNLRQASQQKTSYLKPIIGRIRNILPINITLGLIASVILVFMQGWTSLLQVFLTSIIWITLTSSIIGAIIGKK